MIEVSGVSKHYRRGHEVVTALDDVSFALAPGEVTALTGPSGSGKTTLLNILSGWERQDDGGISRPESNADEDDLAWTSVAMSPQRFALSDELTVRENIELPLILRGYGVKEVGNRVRLTMTALDLTELHDRLPQETSLGEQQRASIARAAVARPALLLADEPTGNQDRPRQNLILQQFADLAAGGTIVLLATHDASIASGCDRILTMNDGRIVSDESVAHRAWWQDERRQ